MTLRLRLLGGFELRVGSSAVSLPPSAQRLVAYICLRERPASRASIAGNLWLDSPDRQAFANLRSAIWRLRRAGLDIVRLNGELIGLAPGVEVDVRVVTDHARAMIQNDPPAPDWQVTDVEAASVLLPDWYDDWVLLERERFRQIRLHALESLCLQLTTLHRFARAAEVGLLVVADEPLRESAHRALMNVHLAEGNVSEALRQYAIYERVMREDLGLGPSSHMRDLLITLRGSVPGSIADGDDDVTDAIDDGEPWRAMPSRSPMPSYARELQQSAKTR